MDTNEIFTFKKPQISNQNDTNFSDRQKNLFDHLKKAEDVNKNRLIKETPMDVDKSNKEISLKRKRSAMKCFQGKESIFKRPEEPLPKCLPVRNIPDFRRNPHKWTKYSLDDVKAEHTSEKGNLAAALSFLNEMEMRKSENKKIDVEETANDKVFFNKSASLKIKQNQNQVDEKNTFKGSKIVMPEYIVGQTKKSVKKSTSSKVAPENKGKEVKLDHLLDYEDDID